MSHSLRWKIAQWFELRWWKKYLKQKDTTQYIEYKTNYWKEFLKHIKEIDINSNGLDILDIGCGPAGVFMVFNNSKVDAVDPLIDKYEAELKHFSISKYPNVNFITKAFEDFESKNKYDLVFCLNTINHVINIDSTHHKIISMLKPNSMLLESVDAHNFKLLKHLFRLIKVDILHPHQYDIEEYEKMLTKKGLTVQKTILIKKRFIFNYYLIVAKLSKNI